MKQIFLILTFCLLSGNITAKAEMQEQHFPCSKNKTIYQCGIWTDGYYAVKTKTYDERPKFEIEDFVFEEIKDGTFDDGNIVVKNGIVKHCKKCRKTNGQGQKSPFLIHKYIVFNKIPNYQKYIENNKIDNLKEFNQNGYFLAFRNKKDKNDTTYLFIYKDDHNKLKAVYNDVATFLYFYDDMYSGEHCACYDIDVAKMVFEEKKIQINNQQMFNKLYSLEKSNRLSNEDVKKVGDDIAIFNQTKREKIENMLKKSDYDFLK